VPAAAGSGGDRCATVGRSRRAFRNGLAADPAETSPDETREQGETSSSTRAWLPRSSPLRSASRPTTRTGRGEVPSSVNLTPWCASGGSSAWLIAAAASASRCRRTVADTAALSSGLSSEGGALTLSGTGCSGGGIQQPDAGCPIEAKCSAKFGRLVIGKQRARGRKGTTQSARGACIAELCSVASRV
jgi:hypothetical protein